VIQATGENHLVNAGRKILLYPGLLGQISDLFSCQTVSVNQLAGRGLLQLKKPLHQSTLAGSVLAYDSQIITLFNGKIHITEYCPAFIGKTQIMTCK
jgi:hypothetical protein